MNKILKAAQFAEKAHRGQIRKYTERPYIEHPMRVAGILSLKEYSSENMICAAYLHDTVEDCDVVLDTIYKEFGPEVYTLVNALTNPSKKLKDKSREFKKALDLQHIIDAPKIAQIIKIVDRLDNLEEMPTYSQDAMGFLRRRYWDESNKLAQVIKDDSLDIWLALQNKLNQWRIYLDENYRNYKTSR